MLLFFFSQQHKTACFSATPTCICAASSQQGVTMRMSNIMVLVWENGQVMKGSVTGTGMVHVWLLHVWSNGSIDLVFRRALETLFSDFLYFAM